ncbi:NADP-dependent oxidoreductase [Oerskovia turbata]|uniref:NADP-dependent oxidoreductase n=1 Tax=Oerskovia turbata TaxID=1713 RepID=A0A4Q1KWS5_9CELL|nr:NADP-dependent oxidoreductase [Oerskovia turbata]RXR25450.1 NADP-dependent oxidoreductase [Oerskovia turbata]RXR33909.1 NADP-dependent oxidoreductase [Oerskovia turbata]TGJ95705.1 NADP-dependent oxidoreductase [Actinotalea fermentans ATCC 43279 = JCM 9966 = DSM 3133]
MSTAIFYDRHGGVDVLRVGDEPVPAPGEGELVVANRVVGVNPADVKRLAGEFGGSDEFPQVLGFEAAGVVEAVGEGVEGFAVGDEVVWSGTGAQRERSVVAATKARVKPANVPFEQAAVLPVAASAAFSALVQAGVGDKDVVLVHGASGGVGSAAVQIAKALGARVVGTASARNHDYVQGLGATAVAYGPGLVDEVRALPDGLADVTAVVDTVGSPETVTQTVDLLGADGLERDGKPRAVTLVESQESLAAGIASKVSQKGALAEVLALAEAELLSSEISARFPLAEAARAVEQVAGGHVRGKVVLEV